MGLRVARVAAFLFCFGLTMSLPRELGAGGAYLPARAAPQGLAVERQVRYLQGIVRLRAELDFQARVFSPREAAELLVKEIETAPDAEGRAAVATVIRAVHDSGHLRAVGPGLERSADAAAALWLEAAAELISSDPQALEILKDESELFESEEGSALAVRRAMDEFLAQP